MKFGKTYHEKYKEEQNYLSSLHQMRFTSFAYLPTKMGNGRWVWLENYHWKYNISMSGSGMYYWSRFSGPKFKYVKED